MTVTAIAAHRELSSDGSELAAELPEAGLGARLRLPAALATVLLLALAAACPFLLDRPDPGGVPPSVVEAQQRTSIATATALAGSAADGVTDLRRIAERVGPGESAQQIADSAAAGAGWTGARVDGRSSRPALAGEPVPAAPANGPPVRFSAGPDGAARLFVTVQFGAGGGTLTATTRTDGTVAGPLWIADGAVLLPAAPGTRVDRELGTAAHAAIEAGAPPVTVGERQPDGTVPVATVAPLAGKRLSAGPDVRLVSAQRAVPAPPRPGGRAILPMATLALLAVGTGLICYRSLVRPQQRLRAAALRIASGRVHAAMPATRVRELDELASAFAWCRSRITGGPAPPTRSTRLRVPAWFGVTAAMSGVVAWSVLTATLVPARPEVPAQLAAQAQASAGLVASRTSASLVEGRQDVAEVAALPADRLAPALTDLLAADGRFRGIRVVDASGADVLSVGRPLLTGPAAGDGVSVATGESRVPVPVAQAGRPDGTVVVAEFDVARLAGVLATPDHHTRLLDGGLRTIAATDGFAAFEHPPAAEAGVARTAVDGPTAVVTDDAVVAAAPVRAGALVWTAADRQPIDTLALRENSVQRGATLLGLLASAIAVTTWVFYLIWHVFPLARAARIARAMRGADGAPDVDSVIYGQYLGPSATILSCLDICRRAARDGRTALGRRRPERRWEDLP